MSVRKPNGELNRKVLDNISRNWFVRSKSLNKTIKKGDKDFIRKLNEKRAKEIKNATTPAQKAKIKKRLKDEKEKFQNDASNARQQLNAMKGEVRGLLNRQIGAIFTNAGNIVWKDLLIDKDRKSMLKDLTIMSDANVSRDELQKKIKSAEKAEKVWKTGLEKMRFRKTPPYKLNREKINKGVKVEYFFEYKDIEGEFNFFDTMEANVKRAINNTKWRHPNTPFNIRISTTSGDSVVSKIKGKDGKLHLKDNRAFSLPRFEKYTIDDVIEIFDDKFERAFDEYEEEEEYFEFKTILISYLIAPDKTFGSGGHKTLSQASKKWFISDTKSNTNCFYRSISFIRLMRDLNENEDLEYVKKVLLPNKAEDGAILNHLINDRAKNMKKRLTGITKKTTSEDDIKIWVEAMNNHPRTRCCVRIYDNVFGLRQTIIPEGATGELKTYDIWCINHHFIPLIRWWELINIREICEEKVERDITKQLEEEGKDETTLIDKKIAREIIDYEDFTIWAENKYGECPDLETDCPTEKKLLTKYKSIYKYLFLADKDKVSNQIVPKNNRIATYDIEATGNGNDDKFKCYRISLVWNILDTNGDIIKTKPRTDGYCETKDMGHSEGWKFKSFGGTNCIKNFFEFIYKNRSEFSAFTFYAHNAGKFDLILLMNEYILKNNDKWKIIADKTIVLNGAYLNMELESVGDLQMGDVSCDPPEIRFRDSYRLLPMSLDKLGIDFNVPHKKQGKDLAIDFDEINIDNCFGDRKLGKNPLSSLDFKIELSQRVYCDYDTICLLECLNIFNKDIYEAMNIDMTGCLTGASLSKQNFFKNYYNKKEIPIYHMSSAFDSFCRDGYMGGRCEAHMIGELKSNCYYYDFTSLYPDVGRRRLPYGLPAKVSKERIDRWNSRYKSGGRLPLIIGMMKFKITTKDFDALPIHGIKKDGKLLFPHFKKPTELTLWANEFHYGHSLDIYEYELLEAIHFGEQNAIRKSEKENFWDEGILSGFFTEAVDKKALAKKQKKPALAQSYKIVANSGYGFWGLNANGDDGEGRDGMEILSSEDICFWDMLDKGEVNNVGSVGHYTLVRTTKPMPCKDFNVAIASAISSEARIKIHKFMNAIKGVGGKLLYCDTDSCICNIRLCDYPHILEEFCWDGTGEDLGSMKNEAEEKLEKYFKNKYGKAELSKHMKKQKELDDGEYSFDKGIIAGCKQYCLYKKTYDGGFIEAEASKGCKRSLDYSDFHHLLYGTKMEEQKKYEEEIKSRRGEDWEAPEGFRLYERQTQFRSGLIEHIKEGNETDVKILNLDKSMRVNYMKGSVAGTIGSDGVKSTGEVKPLILND